MIEPIYTIHRSDAEFQAREAGWNAGFRRGWDEAKDVYFVRGCMAGGVFVAGTIFALAFFLGAK